MVPVSSAPLRNWKCAACGFGWVTGQALADFLPTVRAFEKLRAAAVAGQPSTRSLSCPLCRAATLHLVQAAGAELDVCMKCAGIALDPGELPALSSMRYSKAERVVDAIGGLEALVQILTLFC
jgi:hypothetical protein